MGRRETEGAAINTGAGATTTETLPNKGRVKAKEKVRTRVLPCLMAKEREERQKEG